jgi:hypothetical protein
MKGQNHGRTADRMQTDLTARTARACQIVGAPALGKLALAARFALRGREAMLAVALKEVASGAKGSQPSCREGRPAILGHNRQKPGYSLVDQALTHPERGRFAARFCSYDVKFFACVW